MLILGFVLFALILAAIVAVPVGFVLVITDIVTVPPKVRANATKIATVLFLAMVTWFFVAFAMNMP